MYYGMAKMNVEKTRMQESLLLGLDFARRLKSYI